MHPARIENLPEVALLQVYRGKSNHLIPTGRVIAVPQDMIPTEQSHWALQESNYDEIFWLLRDSVRYCARCFCSRCKVLISGSGGNLKSHVHSHGSRVAGWTPEQQANALFLFFIKHDIGFTAACDPLMRIFSQGVSYTQLVDMLQRTADLTRDAIRDLLRHKSATLMIDGWSDASLRRYLGIGVSFFDECSCRQQFRFLELNFDVSGHSAANQVHVIRECLESFHFTTGQVQCLCSDSAAVNTAVADMLSWSWMPCCCHLWQLIVRNFVLHCPQGFRNILEKINDLRKSTLWVEFLAAHGSSRRNLAGFVSTRWGSVSDCLQSFCEMRSYVIEFQASRKCTVFSEDDLALVDSIQGLFIRFREVTQMLMDADSIEGLATVFEAINAIYMLLCADSKRVGPFQSAICQARDEIIHRFFRLESIFCCRLLFTGILNVAHSIPEWLQAILGDVLGLMASEVELFTGSTRPSSPKEIQGERYSDSNSLSDMINGSSGPSEANRDVCDEIHRFMSMRGMLGKNSFTCFWWQNNRFPHLKMLAMQLRRFPTSTLFLERTFSLARRILSWSRMRLTPKHAGDMCLLSANQDLAQRVLGLDNSPRLDSQEVMTEPCELEDVIQEYIMDEEE